MWDGPPDVLLSEAVDEGLLGERLVPQLRDTMRELTRGQPNGGGTTGRTTIIPQRAEVEAVVTQLSFEGIGGFGLDGLDVDLRHFDALRPSGTHATRAPGWWPVRLLPARQPHRRLSATFAAGAVEFGVESSDAEERREIEVEVTSDGLFNAVVFWFTLHAGEGPQTRCSSAPPVTRGRGNPGAWSEGWRQAACYLQSPWYVRAGERLKIEIQWTAHGVRFERVARGGVEALSARSAAGRVEKEGIAQVARREPSGLRLIIIVIIVITGITGITGITVISGIITTLCHPAPPPPASSSLIIVIIT